MEHAATSLPCALPPVMGPARRGRLLWLTANGLAQGALAVAGAWMTGQAMDAHVQPGPAVWLAFLALGGLLATLKWLELIGSERLGHAYVLEVRRSLLHSLSMRQDAPAPGLWMVRFVTDLNGLRLWVSLGLTRLMAGGATLLAALMGLAWVATPLAGAVGIILAMAACTVGLCTGLLVRAERELRQRRGRLAGRAQRHLQAHHGEASAAKTRSSNRRAQRIVRGSEQVAQAAVHRAHLRGAVRGVADLASWSALGAVVVLGAGLLRDQALSQSDWIVGLTLAGLCTAPIASMVRALEYHHGYKVARDNIERGLRGQSVAESED